MVTIATVGSASGVVLTKNPIGAAMSLVATFFFLAGIYVLLWAHTIAALQVVPFIITLGTLGVAVASIGAGAPVPAVFGVSARRANTVTTDGRARRAIWSTSV